MRCSVVALALLSACDSQDTGDTAGPVGAEWTEVYTSDTTAMSGVWGAGPDDIWAVGGNQDVADVRHFDGSTWSESAVPDGTHLLVWAYGFASDDVFAVGRGGSVLHWGGSAWSTLDSGTTRDLWGVWGTSPTDLWIVGGEVTGTWPLILHYDGTSFTEVPVETDQNQHGGVALFKVWGIDGKVWAVGDLGLIVEWDGTRWVEEFGGPFANDDFVSLWGNSATDVVAVGGRGNGRIARYDGTTWTTEMPDAMTGLNAVYVSGDDAWIGGIYGFTGTYDLASGDVVKDPLVTTDDVHAIWSDGAGHAYGVGGVFAEPYRGFLIRREVP